MKNESFNSDQMFPETEVKRDLSTRRKAVSGLSVFLIFCTVAFLGAGVYLYADNEKKAKENTTLNSSLIESETRYAELDSKYTSALVDLESLKGKNAELDKLIAEKEKSILELKTSLNKERKSKQISEKEFKKQMEALNLSITDLNSQIGELQRQNVVLVSQKDSLGREIVTNQSVIVGLDNSNKLLTQKVTVASLLIPTDIESSGSYVKASGKEGETSRTNKATQLRVCVSVPVNKVADTGDKTFLIRIINPQGSVLAMSDQGSGVFTMANSQEQRQYSTSAVLQYDNKPKDICVHWKQNTPFDKGNYVTEVYQDGYLVGSESFELK